MGFAWYRMGVIKEEREMQMDKIHWHPGYYGGLDCYLTSEGKKLSFETEHQLSKEPLRIDLLIIKKKSGGAIKSEIGRIFKGHNLFEVKGAGDSLNIDVYYKILGYASIYKSLGKHVDEIKDDDITISFIREAFPQKLFKLFEDRGVIITEKYPGIYYLSGSNIIFDTQVIVTRQLDSEKFPGLKILSDNAAEEDVRRFIEQAKKAKKPGDLQNIDAVLQVSVSANKKLYEDIKRRDKDMCQALKDLMKDEIAEEVTKGRADATLENIKNMMKNLKLTAKEAMKALEIPAADQRKYSSMLKAK